MESALMVDQLLTGRNIELAAAVFIVMSLIRMPFKAFLGTKIGQRVMPVLPVLLGISGAFVGLCDGAVWKDKLLIGLIAGWASSHTFKLGRTSIMAYGLDSDEAPAVVPAIPVVPAPVTVPEAPAPAPAVAEKKE